MSNWDSNSIVDYLKSKGKDSSYSARKELAESRGISNYSGTASQNAQLLNSLKNDSSDNKNSNVIINNNANNTNNNGANVSLVNQATSTFTPSSSTTAAIEVTKDAKDRYTKLTSDENIVGKDVYDTLDRTFSKPIEVVQADTMLSQYLSKIQSGKTSYSDDVRNMISKIQNREKFEYDVDSDQLFQQALASAMGSGKQAMQDTIGQASALTGGYGSTYATSAGNQAYNAFIEDAYDNLPQYYQMAFDKYQAEGQDMYNQLAMLSEEDAKEYERLLSSYNATYQYRNQMYNEAYDLFRDAKTDAYNLGNLRVSERNQLVTEAYNNYLMAKNDEDTKYTREYNEWADKQKQEQWKASYILESEKFDWDKEMDNKEFNAKYESDGNGGYVPREVEGGDAGATKLSNGAPVTSMITYKQTALQKYKESGKACDSYINSLGLNQSEKDEISAYILEATTSGVATGIVLDFEAEDGDNFKVSVGDKIYRVENQGEADTKLTDEFNKLNINDGEAFLYNADNRVYVKKGNKYYKTGATEVLGINTSGHSNLKAALYRIANGG